MKISHHTTFSKANEFKRAALVAASIFVTSLAVVSLVLVGAFADDNTRLRAEVAELKARPVAATAGDLTAQCTAWWMHSTISEARARICTGYVMKSMKKGK